MRPAISAAGTREGASRKASLANAARCRDSAASSLARLRRQQHGAAAQRQVGLDMAIGAGDGERVQRAGEIAGSRLQVEQGIDAPGKSRIALDRLIGERAGRFVVVAAPRFEEQPAQPQQLGLGPVEHGLEGPPGGGRSPLSWAACARSNAVKGSRGRLRPAMPA